ncbi:MAG: DUF1624 domain-containing protein [Oscillospiraceae bacterium]|jgi:uncharacterized membrane protein|nr:DUF1624 domain-containing protein [Oscillospiraceae bacterium]
MKKERIALIDALRGLAVALMVVHHALFDAVEFLGAPAWLFSNPVFDVLHYIFAGVFVALAGVSSRFSRSNIRRGILTALAAAAVSAATSRVGIPVHFGVLHLLASCMLLYGLTQKALDRVPDAVNAVVCLVLLVFSAFAVKYIALDSRFLWPLGWTPLDFYSADYFPLFPWLFVFLLGTLAGVPIKDRRLPDRFYEIKPPILPAIGRKSLIIYLLHQPVLYGAALAARHLRG